MTAGELAAAARALVHGGGNRAERSGEPGTTADLRTAADLAGVWPRAVALLARQALERGLDDLWGALAPRVRGVSRHAQLVCLGAFVSDAELVSDVRHAWHGLSRACHHQAYELSPTAGELTHWLDAVDRLVAHDPLT